MISDLALIFKRIVSMWRMDEAAAISGSGVCGRERKWEDRNHEFQLEEGAASLCQLAAGGSHTEAPVHVDDTVYKQALVHHAARERDEMTTPQLRGNG